MTATIRPATSTTPTARARFRRSRLWLVIAVVALLFAIVFAFVNAIAESLTQTEPLDDGSTAAQGAKALATVLREEGVNVVDTDSFSRVTELGADSTLVVRPSRYIGLDYAKLNRETTAKRIVLLSPGDEMLRAFVGDRVQVVHHLDSDMVIADGCDISGLAKVQQIEGLSIGYSVEKGESASECFRAGANDKRGPTVVRIRSAAREIIVVGGTGPFANATVTKSDNAAFALGLLGQHEKLAWYSPNPADFRPPSKNPLPAWIPTVWFMGIMTLVVAAIWRGRRLGPLVVERMPVAVPANETIEGRGRLYEASRSRQHALDAVRERCIRLVSRRAGLGTHPDHRAVTAAVHAATGMSATDASRVLYEAQPGTDRELVSLVEQVQAITRAFEPGTSGADRANRVPNPESTTPAEAPMSSRPSATATPNDMTEQGQRKDDR